ncbi:thioesterase family protein [Chitinimonas sp.]|uniref:thioesterase family protein n=1 Tax=Chitinimonas sp. TaxID=1934313 RepID=UPI0035B1C50B
MARLVLNLPEHCLFATDLPIGIGQINYGGHLGNDSALTLLHEARLRLFASLGFNEREIHGCSLIQTDACLIYKGEAFWGDTLRAELMVDDFNKYGFDVFYRLWRLSDGKDILHAKTGLIFINIETRRPASVPPAFSAVMSMEMKKHETVRTE